MIDFTLRDYQLEGVRFLRERKRALLHDAPGLGKTPQATFAAEPPVLVSAPSYLVPQWDAWLKSLDYESIAAVGYNRDARIAALETGADWTIINHDMVSNYSHFENKKWLRYFNTLIIDESHHFKGHNAKRAKRAVNIAKEIEFVFELSATPVKREIDDLYMQLRILQPDIFTSYWRFVQHFCIVESNYFGVQIMGAKKSMLPELQQILSLCSLGRGYEDVGRELPPIIENYVPVILNPQIRKLYDEAIEEWRIVDEEGNMPFGSYMEAMHTIRQHLTGGLKGDTVASLIEDDGRKTVVFTWYKHTAEAISKMIPDSTFITGDIPVSQRTELAKQAKHVVANIAALSEGVDLSDARCVIFAEEDFTPGANYQALSRVRRERLSGGNDEPITVHYVQCQKTIDEVIHRKQKTRSATAKEVVRESLYL